MNRRNLLKGIGAAAVGGGAIVGSGALTTVSADRSFSVTTADDSSAKIELNPIASVASASGTGNNSQSTLEIDLSDLNDDATTTVDPVFGVENGFQSDGVGIRIRSDGYSSGSEASGLTISSSANGQNLADYPTASGDDHNLDSDDGSEDQGPDYVEVKLTIDTSSLDVSSVSTLTIEADTSEYKS